MDSARNLWRRAQSAKVREGRVITGYIEVKHPEIYAEAITFYNSLNQKYPSKSDLRKTVEFSNLSLPVPVETVNPDKKKKYKKKSYPNINNGVYASNMYSSPPDKNFKDNLELRIPLIPLTTETSESMQNSQLEPIAEADTTELMQNTQIEPTEIIINETDLQSTLNEEFPDDVIDKIVAELQKDAQLESIFDDIDVDIPEVSPLEAELLCW